VGTEKRERQKANRALKHQEEARAAARRSLVRKIAIGVAAVAALMVFVWIASNLVDGSDDDNPTTPVTLPEVVPDTSAVVPDTTAVVPDTSVATTGG
jgi:ferric-dicitrate binding protein FerR (iron transport regulator)